VAGLALLAVIGLLASPGCAGRRPGGPGVIHHVQSGENLYRIGLRYGVPADEIARANGIRDVTSLSVGQRLYIPGARERLRASAAEIRRGRGASSGLGGDTAEARSGEKALELLSRNENGFFLVVEGSQVDWAGHANNTSFVEWVVESVPDEIWRKSHLTEIDIRFLAECHQGQSVRSRSQLVSATEDREIRHQIVRAGDETEVARALTRWSSKD